MPLEAGDEKKWKLIALPDGIEHFCDFDIFSEDEAIICGCFWKSLDDDGKGPLRRDMDFIVNYQTGAITKPIRALEPASKTTRIDKKDIFNLGS